MVEEQCDETDWGEGIIQLPLHFQTAKEGKGFQTNRNELDSLKGDKDFLTVRSIEGKQSEIEELLPRQRVAKREDKKVTGKEKEKIMEKGKVKEKGRK